MAKIDYDKLEKIYETEGRTGANKYLNDIGVKAPRAAIKRMRNKQMGKYDSDTNKKNNTVVDSTFLSMEELCEKNIKVPRVHEVEGEFINPFPEMNTDKLMVELLLDKIRDYNNFFMIDRANGMVHIDKSRLLNAGFEIFMY